MNVTSASDPDWIQIFGICYMGFLLKPVCILRASGSGFPISQCEENMIKCQMRHVQFGNSAEISNTQADFYKCCFCM